MKKLYLLGALFAAGLSFTACSDSNADDEKQNSSNVEVGGDSYLALSINLPQDPSSFTRAATNDNDANVTFSDGLEDEYSVNDATLIIFSSEGAFKAAYTITPSFTASASSQVTESSGKCIKQVGSNVIAGDKALVILNNNGLIKVNGTELHYLTDATTDPMTYAKFEGSFDELQSKVDIATTSGLNCGRMNQNGYYMANAVLCNKRGSTTIEPTDAAANVLVPITAVYKTEQEANNATPDQIYVERGMAKVTLASTGSSFGTSKVNNSALSYTISGWTLDNTNPQSFLVRSTTNFNDYRYLKSQKENSVYRTIGNTAVIYPTTPDYMYRSYFSESANFNHATNLNRVSSETTFGPIWTNDDTRDHQNPQYCFENTFSVANQTVNNTTLVQIKVTAGDGNTDYYTIGGNKTVVYTKDKLDEQIQTATYNYLLAQGKVKTTDAANNSVTLGSTDFTITGAGSGTGYNVTAIAAASEKASYYDLTFDTSTIESIMSEVGTIVRYANGVSYYSLRIKHFGDALTPWATWESDANLTAPVNYTSTDDTPAKKIAKIYPDNSGNQANNYLGRYGVLRNNWYHLTISGIRYLGDAEPKTGSWDPTPDDEFENFVSCQINVLSWAKRTQDANL